MTKYMINKLARDITAGASERAIFMRGSNPRKLWQDLQQQETREYGTDPYGGHFGNNRLVKEYKIPMSRDEADDFIEKMSNRWRKGDAYAIPILESKVIKDARVTVKLRAPKASDAERMAVERVQSKLRSRKNVSDKVIPNQVKMIRPGGMPELETEDAPWKGYVIRHYKWQKSGELPQPNTRDVIFSNRPAAKAALKVLMSKHSDPDSRYALVQVRNGEIYKVVGDPSSHPTFEVEVWVKQVQKSNRPVGYLFAGIVAT